MESYIDIHSHILPGIDDGSKDFSISMQMLRMAAKEGITQIILTPHYRPGRHNAEQASIDSLFAELTGRMADEGISMKLYKGNELHYWSGLVTEILEGKALTMAGSDYVLVEFDPMDDYDYIRNGIYSLMSEGYCPILAHVERYSGISGKVDRVEDLVRMGCYIQVNAGSITGDFGLKCKYFVRKLLRGRLVHFVATDAHDTGRRSPRIRECASYLEKKYGKDYARELLYGNPMLLLSLNQTDNAAGVGHGESKNK